MDAITLLKNDHKTVEKLFKQFEKAGDQAYKQKRQIVDRIIEELSVHAEIEEMFFYPVTRATVEETEDIALESLEEHHVVKWVLSELEKMDPTHERFDAKVTVLIENVRHHAEEEESDYFPKVREALGRNDLNDLGDAMQEAKKRAPTHPHPRSPDTPPGNIVAGAGAAVVDRATDAVSGAVQGGINAAKDLIERFTDRSVSASSPNGSSTARKVANTTRRSAAQATDKAVAATRKAKATGKATTKAATSGAKGTATAATRGAKSTGTTAKRSAKSTATTAKRTAKKTATTARRAAKNTSSTAKRGATSTRRTAKKAASRAR